MLMITFHIPPITSYVPEDIGKACPGFLSINSTHHQEVLAWDLGGEGFPWLYLGVETPLYSVSL
jgi:hypothetical protein